MQNLQIRNKKNIVIVGAGFGGISAALLLAKKSKGYKNEYQIILIDRHHHQLYTPALYEIAAIPHAYVPDISLKSAALIPIQDVINGKPIAFLNDELIRLKAYEKKIILRNNGELAYEFLVLALGSETNYFNIPGLEEFSSPLKTFNDGARLRSAVEKLVNQKNDVKIVVGGAGASGVELVAEFVNFVCALKKDGQKRNHCNVQFILVEAAAEILPGFDEKIVTQAKKRLLKLGIQIKTNTIINSVTRSEITFKDGGKETFDALIWTGGVKGPSIFKNFGLALSDKGSAAVDEYLRVKDADGHIFAIGDNSSFINQKTGKPLVWNVPVAEREGRIVALNILNAIRKKPPKKFKPLTKYPFILAVGKKYAIADLIYIRFAGFWGWFAKQLVELRYLLYILPFSKAINTWFKSLHYFSSND